MEDAGRLQFVRVTNRPSGWRDPEPRRCTLAYDKGLKEVILLGELPHACKIVVDQQLVDDLQAIVNWQKEGESDGQEQKAK